MPKRRRVSNGDFRRKSLDSIIFKKKKREDIPPFEEDTTTIELATASREYFRRTSLDSILFKKGRRRRNTVEPCYSESSSFGQGFYPYNLEFEPSAQNPPPTVVLMVPAVLDPQEQSLPPREDITFNEYGVDEYSYNLANPYHRQPLPTNQYSDDIVDCMAMKVGEKKPTSQRGC